MTKSLTKTNEYADFLNILKTRIRSARISAARVVNKELISLYWEIGKSIVEKQAQLGWGKAVGEIPWGQNLLIMQRIKNAEARAYYLKATKISARH